MWIFFILKVDKPSNKVKFLDKGKCLAFQKAGRKQPFVLDGTNPLFLIS